MSSDHAIALRRTEKDKKMHEREVRPPARSEGHKQQPLAWRRHRNPRLLWHWLQGHLNICIKGIKGCHCTQMFAYSDTISRPEGNFWTKWDWGSFQLPRLARKSSMISAETSECFEVLVSWRGADERGKLSKFSHTITRGIRNVITVLFPIFSLANFFGPLTPGTDRRR